MSDLHPLLHAARASAAALPRLTIAGRVAGLRGGLLRVRGLDGLAGAGDRLLLRAGPAGSIPAEIIGMDDGELLALAAGDATGVAAGTSAVLADRAPALRIGPEWLGRVIDAAGAPLDGRSAPPPAGDGHPLVAMPPPAFHRRPLGPQLATGVRAIDLFTPLCLGQRIGLFAGSGVGKSTLLGQLARGTSADAVVLAMVGERGREVQAFLTDELPEEARQRLLMLVATSDRPALERRDAARAAMAAAEALRDQGLHVLLLLDSVTRFAMALREIALAAGEMPALRGYPASVFTELPRLLERAGPGRDGQGCITAVLTVLVEGGDHDEPIADAVRGILDGHVVLDRGLAERGHFPPIDVLRSVSRAPMDRIPISAAASAAEARRLLGAHRDMAELIRLGAYRAGSDATVDAAIACRDAIEAVLRQTRDEVADVERARSDLAQALELRDAS